MDTCETTSISADTSESDNVDHSVRKLLKIGKSTAKNSKSGQLSRGLTSYAKRGRARSNPVQTGGFDSDSDDLDIDVRESLKREALLMTKKLVAQNRSGDNEQRPITYARRGKPLPKRARAYKERTRKIEKNMPIGVISPPNPEYFKPLVDGWIREVVFRNIVSKSVNADIYYTSPEGAKFRSGKEIERFFQANPDKKCGLEASNFTFKRVMLGWDGPEEYERNAGTSRRLRESKKPVQLQ